MNSAKFVNGGLQAHVGLLLAVTAAAMLLGAAAALALPRPAASGALPD